MPRAKCTLYDPGIETALLIRWPDAGVAGGQVFSEPISNVDLYHGAQHPPAELFDLDADPVEQQNLAGTERYARVERWLDSSLWAWMVRTSDPLLSGPVVSPSYRRAREVRGTA